MNNNAGKPTTAAGQRSSGTLNNNMLGSNNNSNAEIHMRSEGIIGKGPSPRDSSNQALQNSDISKLNKQNLNETSENNETMPRYAEITSSQNQHQVQYKSLQSEESSFKPDQSELTHRGNRILTRNFYYKLEEAKTQIHENFKFSERRRRDKAMKLTVELQEECKQAADSIREFTEKISQQITALADFKMAKIKEFDDEIDRELELFRSVKMDELIREVSVIERRQAEIDEFFKHQNQKEPVKLDVGGLNITAGRDTLTKVEGSLLQQFFSGYSSHQLTNDGRIFIDRDPEAFTHMVNFLRSEKKYLPKDVNTDLKIRLHNEFKYWKADMGSEREMAKLVPDQQRITSEMLATPPFIEPAKPQHSLQMWKTLTPLTVEQICVNSGINIDFADRDFEFKEMITENALIKCQFKRDSDQKQGVGRIIATKGKFDTSIQEGLFINNQLNGYGRIIYHSGNYYQGMIKNDKYEGVGKFVHINGKIEDGMWQGNKFVGPASDKLTEFDTPDDTSKEKTKKTIAFASEHSSYDNEQSQKNLQSVGSNQKSKLTIKNVLHQERP